MALGSGVQWGFIGGLSTGETNAPYENTLGVLKEAQKGFASAGFDFGQVVRTWYYIGDILGAEAGESRYDGVNRARNEVYKDKWPDLTLSPASTGIGMATRRIGFEAIALRADTPQSGLVTWVNNPLQIAPSEYEIEVDSSRKPSFSRAAAVRLGDAVILFISGTASIRGSDVVFPGDPESQTRTTLENIATLIGRDNLAAHCGLQEGATFEDLQQFRIYVKREQDVDIVRDTCNAMVPDVPCAYLIGDICRPECLMEMEAVIAFKLTA